MSASWWQNEIDFVKIIHQVPVKDLGFWNTDDKGKKTTQLETIPVMDLSNDEMIVLQQEPDIVSAPGSIADAGTPKGQLFGILMTYRRMAKGAGSDEKLGFTESQFRRWSTSRTGILAKRISDFLQGAQKKSERSPEAEPESS